MTPDYEEILTKISAGIDHMKDDAHRLTILDYAKLGGCSLDEVSTLETLLSGKVEEKELTVPDSQPIPFTREDVMGKEFYINSTAYFHGELFIGELSRCNGATKDFGRLRFQSDQARHANLGSIPNRARRHVLLTQSDILPLLEEQMETVTKRHPLTREYPYVALTAKVFPQKIKVEFMRKVEDPFDGQIHFQSPDLTGYLHKIQLPDPMELGKQYVLGNEFVTLFDRNDLEGLALTVGKKIQPYLLPTQKAKPLDSLLEAAKETVLGQGRGNISPAKPDRDPNK